MMKLVFACGALAAAATSYAGLYGDTPDAKHAWAVHDWNRPKPVKVEPGKSFRDAPSDAVVLFDGTKESFEKNWCDGDGKPSKWLLGKEGEFYCAPGWKNGGNIYTRGKFGDCQLHIEYRHDADIDEKGQGPQMRGNSGVFLMSSYEIQVLESYYTSKENCKVDNYTDGQAGAVYAENPPMVNPARKPGEWQAYDIVFHQPVWDGLKLVHPGSVTVFFNGVLVQDHWEMEGLTTHCTRRPLAPHETKLPLFLQDHGCVVRFRNIWLRELPSRWDNRTHSVLSADENAVMAERRATAAALFAKIAVPEEVSGKNLAALAEVISYADEGSAAAVYEKVARGLKEKVAKASADELKAMRGDLEAARNALRVLDRNRQLRGAAAEAYEAIKTALR